MRGVHFHASPPPVPCAPCDGAHGDIVGAAQLSRCRAQEWTECSVLGAQSMHAGDVHDGLDGLRLNAGFALEAANARAGQGYQLLVCRHQPRALDSPVQALQDPSIHATVPRLAHYRGAPSGRQILHVGSRPMNNAFVCCQMGPVCVQCAPETGCKSVCGVYFKALVAPIWNFRPTPVYDIDTAES